jgi:hypothetical protein
MNKSEKYKPPELDAGDVIHAMTRAGLGAIPYAGAAAGELLKLIVTPSLEKRRNQWMEEIGMGLGTLEEKMGVVLESLQENDGFIDTAIEATRIAIKTINREKREALKSAILNSALPNPPEESLQQLFLSFIDTLSVWHLKTIEYFKVQVTYSETQKGNSADNCISRIDPLGSEFSELREKGFFDFIWKDLSSRSLITTQRSDSGVISHRTTEIGKLFLDFIKNPIEEES